LSGKRKKLPGLKLFFIFWKNLTTGNLYQKPVLRAQKNSLKKDLYNQIGNYYPEFVLNFNQNSKGETK